MPFEKIKWNFQNIPYGPDMSQKFDMVCKKKDVHAIVYIHGGAYFEGNRTQYPSFLADYTGNNLFATMDYRVLGCPPAWMTEDMGGESYSENSPIVFVNQTWVKEAKEWLETYLG
jgi:hypothetical protein